MDSDKWLVIALFGSLVGARLAWAWWSWRQKSYRSVAPATSVRCERCGHHEEDGPACSQCGFGPGVSLTDAEEAELDRVRRLTDAIRALGIASSHFQSSRFMSTRPVLEDGKRTHRTDPRLVVDARRFLDGLEELAFAKTLLLELGHDALGASLNDIPTPSDVGGISEATRDGAVALATGAQTVLEAELAQVRTDLRRLG